MKKQTNQEIHDFFAEIGHRNGTKLLKERGPEYFRKISAMRKIHGKQKPKEADGKDRTDQPVDSTGTQNTD
jgi:hypothetical protein